MSTNIILGKHGMSPTTNVKKHYTRQAWNVSYHECQQTLYSASLEYLLPRMSTNIILGKPGISLTTNVNKHYTRQAWTVSYHECQHTLYSASLECLLQQKSLAYQANHLQNIFTLFLLQLRVSEQLYVSLAPMK